MEIEMWPSTEKIKSTIREIEKEVKAISPNIVRINGYGNRSVKFDSRPLTETGKFSSIKCFTKNGKFKVAVYRWIHGMISDPRIAWISVKDESKKKEL